MKVTVGWTRVRGKITSGGGTLAWWIPNENARTSRLELIVLIILKITNGMMMRIPTTLHEIIHKGKLDDTAWMERHNLAEHGQCLCRYILCKTGRLEQSATAFAYPV